MATAHSSSAIGGTESVEDASWDAFLTAQTDEQFFAAWLRVLCEPLQGIAVGVVLLRTEPDHTFVPLALWPDAPRDLSYLGTVTQEALRLNAGVLRPASSGAGGFQAALPLPTSSGTPGIVAFDMTVRTEAEAQRLLRQVHWGLGWTLEHLARRGHDSLSRSASNLSTLMEVLADALRPLPTQQLLLGLVNQVCRHLEAARVVIGLGERHQLRAAAISDVAYFENRSDSAAYYITAMDEALEAYRPVRYTAGAATDGHEWPAHVRLASHSGATAILTIPLESGGRMVGALCAERESGVPFSDEQMDWLTALGGLLPPVLEQKRRAEQSLGAHAVRALRTLAARLFGPAHLAWKATATLTLAVVILLAAVHVEYRVTAHTVIEGEIQRAAVAPFDGYVAASIVRAGDVVHRGDVLCQLDDRDLRLERDKWSNEREQHARELRQALASQDLPNVEVIEAQLRQSEAHLALVEEQISKARVIAPFDGVVISGDLTQLIGSPVERGKKLFEIAPLQAYRVILEVDERDIRHVALSQSGKLLVTSLADQPIPFIVSRITPVATAKDGRNYFRIEARLERTPLTLRPGMEGVGKIAAGRKPLWWVLTHGFNEWLQLSVWRWLP
jgi:multidrug efflux pump subunit AcrA (membrane-fusion protein)